MDFGRGPLSHPVLVDAIETLFHPVLVYNNKDGDDAALLKRFGEPAWNNPVVRFLRADGEDVIPRADRIWTLGPLVRRVAAALAAAKVAVPPWLALFAAEQGELASGVFAMHCFWEGEAHLGGLDGVLATRAAWLQGKEVVEVRFDPERLAWLELVRQARRLECAGSVFARDGAQLATARDLVGAAAVRSDEPAKDAEASDRKHALRASPLRGVPMTPAQATKVNAALAAGTGPDAWLAPSQRAMAARVRAHRGEVPVLYDREDLAAAFAELARALAPKPDGGNR